jgi:hypothetical protein
MPSSLLRQYTLTHNGQTNLTLKKRLNDGPMMYVAYQPIRGDDDRVHMSVL